MDDDTPEMVEAVRDAMISTLLLAKQDKTIEDVEALATAAIAAAEPFILERAARELDTLEPPRRRWIERTKAAQAIRDLKDGGR